MRKELIVFACLLVLIVLFIVLRPSDTPKLPVDNSNESQLTPDEMKGVTNVKGFSNANTSNANTTPSSKLNKANTIRPKPTPVPLPYPRISINYSVTRTRSIGSVSLDKNSTFLLVTLDIRNYGYKYFDAHLSKFRMGTNGDLIPLTNISTGKTIDAVIPNNSMARGDMIFLLGKGAYQGKLAYTSANKSENYYVMYKQVPDYEMNSGQIDQRPVYDDNK